MLETIETASVELAEREKQTIFQTYERLPIGEVLSASGSYIYTHDGKRYLDAIAGLGVNALGHSDPRLVLAIKQQAEQYLHLSNLYLQEPQVSLAEKLTQMTGWDKVFFTNSGTEAVEGAFKLARKYFSDENKVGLVGLSNGFHGRTYGPLSVMDKPKYRNGFGPFVPKATTVNDHDVASLRSSVSEATAAVILEVIQGEAGICEVTKEFVLALHDLRKQYGFLIIADEIQSGVGRTGTFFAYEQFGSEPDIVVCAKAIGGGLPLGAILTRNDIAFTFEPGTHGTTFGGNALACAAGCVVLERLASDVQENVQCYSPFFHAKLNKLRENFPTLIRDVRGKGYMIGIEMYVGAKQAAEILLAEHHIIVNVTGNEVIRILPPLIWSENEINEFLQGFESVLMKIILNQSK